MSIRRMMLFTLGAKIKNLIEAFKTRVFAAQGEFEAETCLEAQLTDLDNKGLLDSASLIVTPNGYRETLLFAVEPDKVGTNLLLHSQDWTQAVWDKGGATIVSSTRVAPDGTSTGTELSDVGASGTPGVPTQNFITTSTIVTFSIYTKAVSLPTNGRRIFLLRNSTTSTNFDFLNFNYSSTGNLGNGWFSQNVGNGWFRLSYTRTTGISVGDILVIYYGRTGAAPVGATDVWQVWGAQVDTGATLNDYISTTSVRIINGTIGDMSVTRATTGTRVNADGLIEEVPYNIFQRSEEFDNASWVKTRCTISSNTTTAPNGTLTADSIIQSSGQTTRGIVQYNTTISNAGVLTYSIFAKKNTKDFLILTDNTLGTGFQNSFFNLNTGVLGTIASGRTASIQNVGSGWYRCSITVNPTISPSLCFFIFGHGDSDNTTTVIDSGGIFIWGAQLVTGTQPRDYFPTTNRFNVPRIDYSNGSCPSILVEPQRTNLALRSEEFDNASWFKTTGVVVTSNSEMSPNGTLTADTINFGASNRLVSQTTTLATGVVVTGSIYVKGISGQTIQLAVGGVDVLFTLNGSWQRLEATRTSLNNTININTFGGATARIISVWGAQLELGANATSYIPTVASTVTRNADVISKTGVSSLIGQLEGTIYLNLNILPSSSANLQVFRIDDLSDNNRIRIITTSTQRLRFICQLNGNIVQYDFTTIDAYTSLTSLKMAFAYKSGDIAVYINGIQANTSSNVLTFSDTLSRVQLSSLVTFGVLQQFTSMFCLFPTRLTNTQLQQLTTL